MVLVQFDLPDDLNKNVKKTMVDFDLNNKTDTILAVLRMYYEKE